MFKTLMPKFTWQLQSVDTVYLTFDDGPHPEITPKVLALLAAYQAKATFFCVGDNVSKYPAVYQQIVKQGHEVGNHTFNHLKGWRTQDQVYLANVAQARQFIDSKLFRPPYGRITKTQSKCLLKDGYKIIMWTVLSGDFDTQISGKRCYQNIVSKLKMGDIIVFHDSEKASERLFEALPEFLNYCQLHNIKVKAISESII